MSHAFDGHSFEDVLTDCERLLAGAADHEHRFASLLSALEQDCEFAGASVTDRAAGPEPHTVLEPSASLRANDLLATVRRLCIAARQQRQLTETILARLVGDWALRHSASESGNRVLVADDSADSRDMAADVLETHGFHAITADNGLEALIVAHYARPVVVVMDLTMPMLDGIQAARLLKASSVTRHLNVIAYTAQPDAIEGPLARFFAHVLSKPTKPELIVASVREFLVPWPSRADRATPPRSI
jgi:CheY-like chemotaxis protein